MKRLFTSFIMVAAMLCGTTAWAQLKVAGHDVDLTATTVQTITGSGITGKVTYNPDYKQLILEDATITTSFSTDGIYNWSVEDLHIYFVGTVKITTNGTSPNVAGVFCNKKTSFSSYSSTQHTPTVTISSTGSGPAIQSVGGADISIFTLNLTATASSNHAIYASTDAVLRVLSSSVMAKTSSSSYSAIMGFTKGLSMTYSDCPLSVLGSSYSFDQSTGSVVSDGTPVQTATIFPAIMIGDQPLSYTTPEITTTTTGASSVSGTVRFYSGSSPWLELEDFSMTGKSISCRIPDLEVRIKGTNSITTSSNNTAGIFIYDNTTFTGEGSLTVDASGTGSSAFSTYNGADVTIDVNELVTYGTSRGFYGQKSGILTLKKYSSSSIYKFAGGVANIYTGKLVMDGMDIWTLNTYFNASDYTMWYDSGVATATSLGSGTWFKSTGEFTYYPVYVGGTQVNNRNYTNVRSTYITSGTVTYNSSSKTLTLSGVQFEATGDDAPIGIDLRSGMGNATLNFTGADQHWTTDNDVFAFANSSTTISGDCKRVYLTSNKESGISTRAGASVTVKTTGYLGAKGAKYGYWGCGASPEVLTLSKTSDDTFGYNFEGTEGAIYNVYSLSLDNMDFAYLDALDYLPGCYFDADKKRVVQNGGQIAKGKVAFLSIQEKLPIYVAGKRLNKVVSNDSHPIYVGSPYITSGPMSVKYLPSTKTLTLTDATIVEHGNDNSTYTCAIGVTGEGVTINAEGTNNLAAGNYGIYSNTDIAIGGSGNLNLNSTEMGALAIYGGSNERTLTLQFSGGVHSFQGKTYGFWGWNTGTLAINKTGDGALYKFAGETADIGDTKSLALGDGVRIHSRYTWFNEDEKAMYRYDAVATSTDIGNATWIRGDVEWIDYPLYICDTQLYGAIVGGELKGPASGFCCKQYGGSGISYDPEAKTLYMNGVTIDDTGVSNAVRNKGIDGLTIHMTGDNNFKVADNIYMLDCTTTFTGNGTVKGESDADDGFGIFLSSTSADDLTLDGPTFEFKGQEAIGGYGNNNVTINSKLTYEPGGNPISALYYLSSVTFGNGMDITFPRGAYYDTDQKAVTTDGENIYKGKVVIDDSATPYSLEIAGVTVNDVNQTDILHDGVFSYDPDTKTLTINGDCTFDDWIVNSEIEDLTINVSGNSTLTQQGELSIIRLFNTTTITGGKLTLKCEASDALGIYISEGESLTIKDADIDVTGDGFDYGIAGEPGISLLIDNSNISASAHSYGCIYDWSGITLTNCYIEQPEVSVIKSDGIYGIEDHLMGSADDTETVVIKAGELTGIANSEQRIENNSEIYDLNGRKLNPQSSILNGIYIQNGKKVKVDKRR